jgi:RND superfamily putative drug exporter
MKFTTESTAKYCVTRPKRVIGIWLGLLVISVAIIGSMCESAITSESEFLRNQPDSVIAERLLEERVTGPSEGTEELLIVRSATLTVDDPAFRERVETLYNSVVEAGSEVVNGQPIITSATNYYQSAQESLVSTNRQTTIMPLNFSGQIDDAMSNLEKIQPIVTSADGVDGFEAILVGNASFNVELNSIAERDLVRGELIGITVALVILVLVFRAVGAAPIPIIMAAFSIILALAATSLIGQLMPVSFFIVNMITMIGLAVGIDYSLFIVARYREERNNGRPNIEAVTIAGATASRAVLFSGITVILALLGMLLVPAHIYFSLGLGAILAAFMAILAALTLLPAILGVAGDRVNTWRLRGLSRNSNTTGGFWDRLTNAVLARPIVWLTATAGLLILLAIPALDLKTGSAGVETFSRDLRVVQGFDILVKDFSAGLVGSMVIVVDSPTADTAEVRAGVERLQALLAKDPIFSPSEYQVNDAGNIGVLRVPVNAPSNEVGFETVRNLRNNLIPQADIPADVYVGGGSAGGVDFINIGNTWLPIVLVFVLSLSFALLCVVFRSIVVPIKAIAMNLLAVGATYGLIVAVFQKGIGADLLGFTQVDSIDSWIPLFLFTVLFGLSMDYHVVLLSRIRERYDHTGNSDESVAFGLRTTAGMITGAAVIMVAVFGGFALADLPMFEQMGFGLAVAVLIDATIVRSILVPSTMKLLGARNWYLPGWLSWLPELNIERREPATSLTASKE